MDIDSIKIKAQQMKSREDLLVLLNILKQEDMGSRGSAHLYHPFEMRQILRYCNPNLQCKRYVQFNIPKKKAGEFRTISAPASRAYMAILHYVDTLFRIMYQPSDYAMGFANGRSVVNNASIHKGQNYVFNLDLKDFFPSIEQARVWKRLQLPPFNFTKPIANVLAGLCSMRETRQLDNGEEKEFFVLPQGAPTSPSITNMICDKLDRRLAGVAKKYNLKYSRYADDITFSSMHNVYQENSEVRKEIKRIIEDQGFHINEDKTRLQKLGSRQEVTGLIVSHKINVAQKYVRDIRNLLYIWDRYGFVVAERNFLVKYRKDKGHVKKGVPNMVNVIEGKLLYLKMVKGDDDSLYLRLYERFMRLCNECNVFNGKIKHIVYIETKPVADFEKLNHTKIVICHKNVVDKNDVLAKMTREAKGRYAYFINDRGIKELCSINRNITEADEEMKDKLSISYCAGMNGEMFWLIHYSDKVTVNVLTDTMVDELDKQLDSLLN